MDYVPELGKHVPSCWESRSHSVYPLWSCPFWSCPSWSCPPWSCPLWSCPLWSCPLCPLCPICPLSSCPLSCPLSSCPLSFHSASSAQSSRSPSSVHSRFYLASTWLGEGTSPGSETLFALEHAEPSEKTAATHPSPDQASGRPPPANPGPSFSHLSPGQFFSCVAPTVFRSYGLVWPHECSKTGFSARWSTRAGSPAEDLSGSWTSHSKAIAPPLQILVGADSQVCGLAETH
ncbi:hypothetical protein CLUG_04180 [Clavispora lusitaniae ATCC 42720]|uniref:Uncharacterized protein n=1 Tax=Clavispora lusitaniae (strain ATCC 42720) TaxID=306902 RepID=C4Y7K2_CLAL4|nr:uncharacterized protein CLUG_04180 [Clavispora lusitaniae ATCC 42720]EEQ40052.1 hypothetical protein CLUG_04180 [Clavispora lusitaniae ATCC 42720]